MQCELDTYVRSELYIFRCCYLKANKFSKSGGILKLERDL